MTIHEFAELSMNSARSQLEHVLGGMSAADADVKVTYVAMSPKEILTHLGDCYLNASRAARGQEVQWGSFAPVDNSWESILAACRAEREQAVRLILEATPDKVGDLALGYIVLHDAYHVGQLALARMQTDSSWDPYSIYQ